MTSGDRYDLVLHRLAARDSFSTSPLAHVGAANDITTSSDNISTAALVADLIFTAVPIGFGFYMYYGQHVSGIAALGWGFLSALGIGFGALTLGLLGAAAGFGIVAYAATHKG